ncbi:MAG: sulfonate transport system permease protein [Pseudonocardiales bacterium]|nr:sulfonate transport system permease protein [Pseudonocardiales bacterium]
MTATDTLLLPRTRSSPGREREAVEPLELVDPRPATRGRHSIGLPRGARRTIGPIVLIAVWQLVCAANVVDKITLASPTDVVHAGQQLAATGELQSNLWVSMQRVGVGLALGASIGLCLALVAGLSRLGEDLVDPTVQIVRAVPILGLVPLTLIWFGVGEAPKIFLIALGSAFPVYLNTFAAIRAVDTRLVEAGATFGLGRAGTIGRVLLPGAVPGFLVGLRFALVGSWLIIIIAEQINATSGLGYLINAAQTWGRTDIILLGLAIYGLLGITADGIIRLLERRLLTWRPGFTGR